MSPACTAVGNRLRQQLIDEETREPVGPEVAKGQYVLMDDAELEAIEIIFALLS